MALVVADRVQETTTTTGTGTYTLAGAKAGFQSFAAVGDGNTTYYACTDGTDYEVGIGTYTATGTTLARTTIIESSNSDLAVSWGAGSKDIFVTLPASKATVLDASGNATFTGDVTFEGATAGRDIVFDRSANQLRFSDNAKAVFGDGTDATINWNGSALEFSSELGDVLIRGNNEIKLQAHTGENFFVGLSNGASTLYYDNSAKLATTSTGIDVTGNITASGTVDGVDIATNIPASLGTAGQVLTVNAGATAGEWADAAGGGADLYAANESTPAAQPSATGANAVAIGDSAVASGEDAFAIGLDAVASGVQSMAFGRGTDATSTSALALGSYAQAVTGNYATAISRAYASGADSFAAAIANNTSSYGATGANSIAIGYLSKTTGLGNVNIGYDGYSTGTSGAVAIGYRARATGTNAISLGQSGYTTASGTEAFASGYAASAAGDRSIAFGRDNTVSSAGDYGLAIGGNNNSVTGSSGVVVGGNSNEASNTHTFATGHYAKAAEYGKVSRATGRFSATGDAQGGQFILRADTTDATATVLTADNSTASSTNQIVAASDTCIMFSGTIVAMQNGAQDQGGWEIKGLLKNDGGTTTLVSSNIQTFADGNGWTVALSADNTNNALAITCTGEAAHNIRWVANISTSEVTYA